METHSETNKTLVAEIDDEVIGFMSFGLEVDEKKLLDFFDLSAYLKTGDKKVFCIQLFCMDDQYASQAYDLVRAAFQILPYFEYCVLTTPHTGQEHPLWRNFVQIPALPGKVAP